MSGPVVEPPQSPPSSLGTLVVSSSSDSIDSNHQDAEGVRNADVQSSSDSAKYRKPLTVAVSDLSFTVKPFSLAQKLMPSSKSSIKMVSPTGNDVGPNRVELLSKINLVAKPGELVAIMGPSGCGKTTLLNVITGRARGNHTGQILFNGLEVPCKKLRGSVTMLHSNDKLLPYLTVEETLTFSAFLKMAHTTPAKRKERVEDVMKELSLTHVRHTQIGGVWKKGLSSGELRRTSIAQELIGNPSVLFLDEPTSGLDAVLAYEVVFVLRRLAAAGRTVVCTLHQPRSSICHILDKVILMANGRLLYHGGPAQARPFFEQNMGRVFGPSLNLADALIDIASDVADDSASPSKNGKFAHFRQTGLSQQAAEKYVESPELARLLAEIEEEKRRPAETLAPRDRNVAVQWLAEVGAVAFRGFRNTIRNPQSFGLAILIQALSGILLGCIFYKLPNKFLPEKEPLYIGDPQSGAMTLLNSDVAVFFTTGIDQAETNPFVDMIRFGVDGNGSQPLDVLMDSDAPTNLMNMMPCTHKRLQLDKEPMYASVDFTPYYDAWEGAWDESDYEGGPWTAPHIASNVLMTLQVADKVLNRASWYEYWKFCRSSSALKSTPLACYGCISGAMEFLGAADECTGLPPMPTMASSCRAAAAENPDDYDYPPGFIPKAADVAIETRDYRMVLRDRIVDLDGVADPASVQTSSPRKLQASSLLSGGLGNMEAFLPPTLANLGKVIGEYVDSFRICAHPACKKFVQLVDGSIAETGSTLADYGAVFGAVMNVAGALFFIVAEVGFASYDGLISISSERPIFNREVANHLYRPSSYLVGKCLGDFLFQLIPSLFLVTTFYALVGIGFGPHGAYFWVYLAVNICAMFASYGFSYALSAVCPTMESAVVAAPLALVILLCCSGFFVRDSAIPAGMVWVKWLSLYRWGFFALCLNQFPHGKSYYGIPNSFNLAIIGISENSIGKCCGVLLAMGVIYRIVAYGALKFMNRRVGVEQ